MVDPAEIHQLYEPQFAAVIALYDFAKENRPVWPDEKDAAAVLQFRTYVRASKSYQGAYKLAYDGYGGQAFVLGRTLYEDMLVGHWIARNAATAPAQFDRHRKLIRERLRLASSQAGLPPDETDFAPLPEAEYQQLAEEWKGKQHWTKLSMDKLKKDVQRDFPEADSHLRLLNQVDNILHRLANLATHHSYYSLGVAVAEVPDGRRVADVGASPTLIPQALFIAFFSYLHLLTLTLRDDAKQQNAAALWHEHIGAFTATRDES